MKYRTGFVTNSSSTSFGAAGMEALIALIMFFLGLCVDKGKKKDENSANLKTYQSPQDGVLKCDDKPIWVYGQIIEINDKGEEVVNAKATSAITFEITDGNDFARIDGEQEIDGWKTADVYGVKKDDPKLEPPANIVVRISGVCGETTQSKDIELPFNAPPMISFDPNQAKLLSESEEDVEIKYSIKGGEEGIK